VGPDEPQPLAKLGKIAVAAWGCSWLGATGGRGHPDGDEDARGHERGGVDKQHVGGADAAIRIPPRIGPTTWPKALRLESTNTSTTSCQNSRTPARCNNGTAATTAALARSASTLERLNPSRSTTVRPAPPG
jgi:hypothetical protein